MRNKIRIQEADIVMVRGKVSGVCVCVCVCVCVLQKYMCELHVMLHVCVCM